MQQNSNLSPLAFYGSIEEQDFRRGYSFGESAPIFARTNYILPFQIVRPHRTNQITSAVMYRRDGGIYKYLSSQLVRNGLFVKQYSAKGYDVVLYNGILPVSNDMEEGRYYISLSDGVQTWYSEVFTCVSDATPLVRIEWWDNKNLAYIGGEIVYDAFIYKNVVYLRTELGKPEYTFEEEGESRDGFFFPTKQVSVKTYKCVALCGEPLIDCMRTIRMSDNVRITDGLGREFSPDKFLLTPKWQEQGNVASVEIEFTTDAVVKKAGISDAVSGSGDFGNDYSDDYYGGGED